MKKKILIIIAIISVCLIVLGIIVFNFSNNGEPYELKEKYRIQNCKSDTCPIASDMIFAQMKYNTDISEIKEVVNKVNDDTNKFYKQVINSKMNDKRCNLARGLYKYSESVVSDYNSYTNDGYITFAVKRTVINVCTNETNDLQVKSYIYDRNKKKFISSDILMDQLNISFEQIQVSILGNNYILHKTSKMDFESAIKDYVLYYDTVGNLIASYYDSKDKLYHTVRINQKTSQ